MRPVAALISDDVCASTSGFRLTMQTSAPNRANACAMPRQMPVPPPVICALAIPMLASIPAIADRNGRSVADCTNFNQADKGDSLVEFTIHNSFTIPVDCAISWRVVCAPDAPKRRASHAGNASLKLASDNASQSAEASAAVCGDDSWAIQSIQWSCQPNRD